MAKKTVGAARAELAEIRRALEESSALDECERLYKAGDPFALIEGMRICLVRRLVAPEWICNAFFNATNRWYALDVTSLDEALGVAYRKGTHVNAIKKRRTRMLAVYHKVTKRKPGRAIDDGLFEEIGKTEGLCRSDVGKYYSEAREALKNPVAAQMLLATWALHELQTYSRQPPAADHNAPALSRRKK